GSNAGMGEATAQSHGVLLPEVPVHLTTPTLDCPVNDGAIVARRLADHHQTEISAIAVCGRLSALRTRTERPRLPARALTTTAGPAPPPCAVHVAASLDVSTVIWPDAPRTTTTAIERSEPRSMGTVAPMSGL